MRIGHVSIAGTHKSGLCESVHALVKAERELGADAEIVLPEDHECNDARGIPVRPYTARNDYDVVVSHSGIALDALDRGQPIVYVCHGGPYYVFLRDGDGHTSNFYSRKSEWARHPQYAAFVTFYPKHLPYWRLFMPEDRLHLINPPLDMEYWCDGATDYDFGGKAGKINVVCATTWRDCHTMFHIVNAFAEFARSHAGAKLHIYGIGREWDMISIAWQILLRQLHERGWLGEIKQWTQEMRAIYRAADMSIVPVVNATNTVRQSLACGCPLVAEYGNIHAPWTASQQDVVIFAEAMRGCWKHIQESREIARRLCCEYARKAFDPMKAARTLLEIITNAYEQSSTSNSNRRELQPALDAG